MIIAMEDINAPYFTVLYQGPAKLVRVVDGDTIHAQFPIDNEPGAHVFKWKCRLAGIDADEIRTRDAEEKKRGIESKKYLESLLKPDMIIGCSGLDVFGRVLITIFIDNVNINEYMIQSGKARIYSRKRRPNQQ
jgi:endonuclease YncB( thermonuclease family)